MRLAVVFAALLPAFQTQGVPDPLAASSAPLILYDNYDPSQPSGCQGVPPGSLCSHTLVGLYYPDGKGPAGLGFSNPPAPVFINLRGGNWNPSFPELYPWFAANVLPRGFVGVDPNYTVVGPSEGFAKAELGVARLIQYLRHNAVWLNIDPERIFLFGRSFGGFLTFALGLREDHADPASAEPMHHFSSRPNFLLPYSAPTDLSCLSDQVIYTWLVETYFPVALAPGATLQEQLVDSPVYWLENPALYGRTVTPPMFMGYHLGVVNPCGASVDPHDGHFGLLMRDRLDGFVLSANLPELGLGSKLINTSDLWGYTALMTPALDWAVAQLEPTPPMMYQPKPIDPITPQGSVQVLRAIGAVPFAPVHYFVAFTSAPIFLPWCPTITEGLPGPIYLGSAPADAEGRANLPLFVPPGVVGIPLVFHMADLVHCRVTQILPHTWTE